MNELGGYAFADLRVGMCATFAKTITEADIVLFAVPCPATTTPSTSTRSFRHHFKGRIAHGMLSASVISAAIACPVRAASTCRKAWRFELRRTF
jgi:3-hydroxybutyryl-CoA dehydratase